MNRLLQIFIATVWLVNGLFCKVLNLVPRHRGIVARFLGDEQAATVTVLIGVAEVGMAIWVLSGVASRFNAVTQIVVVATMNLLEFILVPDLLLWGRLNAVFALLFISIVWYKEFRLKKA